MTTASRSRWLAAGVGFLGVLAADAQPLVSSTFDTDADGWTAAGNGAGAVSFADSAIGLIDSAPEDLAFVAPGKFLGDLTLAYRGSLTFELLPSVRPFAPSRPRVELTGGGLTLVRELPAPATFLEYAPLVVRLQETAGWEVSGQMRPPTAQEFRDVLAAVTELRIVADSGAASDEFVGLDSVAINRPAVRVFVAAGQSNMSGCADSRLVPSYDFSPRADILFWNQLTDTFGPLATGSSDASCAQNNEPEFYFGPEIAFGHAMASYYPGDQILIIKYTEGGTSLPFQWVPPGIIAQRPNGGDVWMRFRDELDLAFGVLDAEGYEYTVEGFIWHQGERDGEGPNGSANYEVALIGFIDWVRTRFNDPELPFVLARTKLTGLAFLPVVRAAQQAVADADPNACWFDTDDLTLVDNVHIDADSQLICGDRFAERLRGLLAASGDVNRDGSVDIKDLYAWQAAPLDLNCDQVADEADRAIVERSARSQ
ncbi:MAG: sialate O-acetylesterase [Phycisphaerales bacterium]